MHNKLVRVLAATASVVVAVTTIGTGAAVAAPELNPDRASWWTSTAPGPDLQFRVTRVVETSSFVWDWGYLGGHKDERTWPRPMIIVGDGVPAVAKVTDRSYRSDEVVLTKPAQHISGNSYRLTVPGGVLDAQLEHRGR